MRRTTWEARQRRAAGQGRARSDARQYAPAVLMTMKPPAPRLLPDGGTVLITGSGPSLTQADVTYARKHVTLTIAVNDSYIYAPDAEILYAGDEGWWKWHQYCRAPHIYQ